MTHSRRRLPIAAILPSLALMSLAAGCKSPPPEPAREPAKPAETQPAAPPPPIPPEPASAPASQPIPPPAPLESRSGLRRDVRRPVDTWVIFREAFQPENDAVAVPEWTGDSRLEVKTLNVSRLTIDLNRLPKEAPQKGPWNLQIDGQPVEITGFRGKVVNMTRSPGGRWTVDHLPDEESTAKPERRPSRMNVPTTEPR